MRILVVDDYLPFASSLRMLLSDEHEVEVATSGENALALIAASPAFDLLLCDVIMPGLSGFPLLSAIAEARPGLDKRVIFMTGGAISPELQTSLEKSGHKRLQKPFASEALRTLIDSVGSA